MRCYLLLLSALVLILSACTSVAEEDPLKNLLRPVTQGVQKTSTPVEQAAVNTSWFQANGELLSNWVVKVEPESREDQFPIYSIDPRDDTFSAPPDHRLLFLYTKSSPFFDKSVADILSLFIEKQHPVDGVAVLIENDQAAKNTFKQLKDRQIDLIFTMGSDATALLHEHDQKGDIPVVSVLSKDPVLLGQMPNYERGSGTNMAYTSVGVPIDQQVDYFRQLIPDLKNIAVVYAKQNLSALQTQVEPLREYLQQPRSVGKSQEINLIDLAVVEQSQAGEELESLIPEAIIKIRKSDPEIKHSIFLITGSSEIAKEFETINKLASKVPVVSLFLDLVQEGTVSAILGIGVSFESNSRLAGLYGIEILQENKKAGDLPVGVITAPDLAINFAKARQIGLKVPFSFFERAAFIYGPDGKAVRITGK